jgi:hypothetical protein
MVRGGAHDIAFPGLQSAHHRRAGRHDAGVRVPPQGWQPVGWANARRAAPRPGADHKASHTHRPPESHTRGMNRIRVSTTVDAELLSARAAFGQGSQTPLSSMRLSGHCWLVIDRPRWTRAMRPTTNTRPMSPTSGVTWRRGGGQPAPCECASGARGALVVRDSRDRLPPSRCAVARRGDPPASAGTCCTIHDDHSGARQRSCASTRF